ncbi:MAG: hypothetical protein ACRESJ_19430 [Pseudomonas sp.]|uniref:hypothetical protein n=1 Tax=Pseudomonas sp. TaxID=306 RepID=UPI003D6E2729
MSVQPGPTDKRYAANGVSTIYAVPFLVIEAGDLKVYLNGVLVTSGYTHTGVGSPTSSITFTVAPTGDLYLQLEVPFQRLVDYQENGDLLAGTVNRDFDRIWQALKQLDRYSSRSPILGVNDIDGFGSYRAKGNRLAELGDPIDPQDAVNKRYAQTYIAGLLGAITGPINNAANVYITGADGLPHVVQDIAGAAGSDVVGHAGVPLSKTIGKIIRPEQFPVAGPVGVGNAVADTAAWQAAANALPSGGKFKAEGDYLINGQILFPFRTDCQINLKGANIYQQQNFKQTLRFTEHLGTELRRGRFYGRGGAAGEYNGASSSYNQVAAVYFDGGDEIVVDGLRGRDHAGGCVVMMGVTRKTIKNCDIKGIGYPYIDPVGQGNQGNGSDFGIMCQPKNNALGWIYEDYFLNNRIRDTAFGIQSVQTRICQLMNNDIGPCLGQHGFYGIENDGLMAIGNTIRNCYQGGIKTQFENYSGFNMASLWVASTLYTVGQKVRFSSILWICVVANSDAAFNSSKWVVDPLTFRKGTVIHNNNFEANGYDVLIVSSSLSDGREIYNYGASIKHNVSRNCVNNSISIDRCVEVDVSGNDIDGGIYGIFGRDLSGRIADNKIKSASKNGIATSLYGDMQFDNNDLTNCGLSGTADDSRAVVLIYAPTAAGIPSQLANPTVYFRNNGIKFPTADGAGNYLVFDADPRNRWHIEGTYGTTTTKKFRIDGGNAAVKYQFRNHFAQNGFLNTAQNEPAYAPTISTTVRTFDSTTVTLPNLANALGTFLADQKAKFTVK